MPRTPAWASAEKYGFTVRFYLPACRNLAAQGDGTFTIHLNPDNPYTVQGSHVDGDSAAVDNLYHFGNAAAPGEAPPQSS